MDLMETKQEYIDALERMTKEYYSTFKSPEEANKFNNYSCLFKGLVDEHLEEKTETNYEHYKDEIIENCSLSLALVDGKPHKCCDVYCCDCGFSTGHGCGEKIKEWLNKPYEKPTYKLSQFEYDLIKTFDRKKWFRQTKIDVQKQIESEFEKTKNELLKEFDYLNDEREGNNGEAC